jgi:excisionase family DNA binding protein
MTFSPHELFTIEQAGVVSEKSARTIARAIAAGQLPFQRIGRRVLVYAKDLVQWVEVKEGREGEEGAAPNNELGPLNSLPSSAAALEAEAAATDALIAWVRAEARAKALKGAGILSDEALDQPSRRTV